MLSALLYGAEFWPITTHSCSSFWFSIISASAAFLGCAGASVSTEELLRHPQQCHVGATIRPLRQWWLGYIMRMPDEHMARQVLFGQLRGMVGVRYMAGAGINSAWRRLHAD